MKHHWFVFTGQGWKPVKDVFSLLLQSTTTVFHTHHAVRRLREAGFTVKRV